MGLYIASVLITFLLQTIAAWCVCLLLVRVAHSPRIRFGVWLTWFVATFFQWAWLWEGIAKRSLPTTSHELSHASSISSTGHSLLLSPVWEQRAAPILVALAVCYGAVLCGLFVRVAWDRVQLRKALSYKVAPSKRLSRVFSEVSLLVPTRDCKLWVLPGLTSPATFGWWRPQIVVPSECESQDNSDLEAIFWHELTHVQRRDALWNAIVRGCRNVLWFHPCVHHALAAISIERELACDRVVVEEHLVERDTYATCLLRFARLSAVSDTISPCIELASGTAFLNLRVQSILAEVPQFSSASILRRTIAGFGLIAAMSVLAPSLRILLTSAQILPALISHQDQAFRATTLPTKGRPVKSRHKAKGIASPIVASPEEIPVTPHVAQINDPQLAASHRVGMEVLTQYGDGQAQDSDEEHKSNSSSVTPSAQRRATPQTSWSTVAVGAAERLYNIDFDHDHDRR